MRLTSATPLLLIAALVQKTTAATGVTPAEIKEILDTHNKYREKHHTPALTWDATIAESAQNWSNNCSPRHSNSFAENLGENSGVGFPTFTAAIDAWYQGVMFYNYINFDPKSSDFTQVVWKSTIKVGCGVQTCNGPLRGDKVYVCNYSPPGNIFDPSNKNYKENVLKP